MQALLLSLLYHPLNEVPFKKALIECKENGMTYLTTLDLLKGTQTSKCHTIDADPHIKPTFVEIQSLLSDGRHCN